MYDSRTRNKHSERELSAHTGAATDFLRRHRIEAKIAATKDTKTRCEFVSKLFGRVPDTRNLRAAFNHLRAVGGDAPGIDKLRPSDIDSSGVWEMLRVIRSSLLDDTYRPARMRKKKVPKTSGTGYRTLSIPTLVDRVVQRALVQVIEPFLDPQFDDDSFGFRPRRGRVQALARATRYAVRRVRRVWIAEDLANAFDTIPQQRLLDVLRIRLPDDRLLRLIERLVVTPSGRGVSQGGPASALLLNMYLDHHLDRRWRQQQPSVPLIRVADDLLLLCRDVAEAGDVYQPLADLLRPTGMLLKGNAQGTTRDLSAGQVTEWLGYRIICDNEMQFRFEIADRSWKSLANKLTLAHTKPLSPLVALDTIAGWICQQGPTYAERIVVATYERVRGIALELGFEEIPSITDLRTNWLRAHADWVSVQGAEWGQDPTPSTVATKEETKGGST